MDCFSNFLEEANLKLYQPLITGNCKVSHLLFADDLLVVGMANSTTASSLKDALDMLHSYLGLAIDRAKSSICFSGKEEGSREFLETLNINKGSFPFKYLGLLLVASGLKSIHFNTLFDKLSVRLAGWKSKLLSLGDCLLLLKSSVNGYLAIWFRAVHIPKSIIKKINSLTAKFFEHVGETNKLHIISWAKTTLLKVKRGNGLLSATTLNTICKLKTL